MFTWIWIFEIVLLVPSWRAGALAERPFYTCEQFERGAHFDPYVAIESMWKIFYFWANTTELYPIVFSLPSKKRMDRFRVVVQAVDPDLSAILEWRHATLVMEPRPGVQVLLLYQGTPGAFRALIKMERRDTVRPHPAPHIKFADVRMKLADGYMGIMSCDELTGYALSKLYEIPDTELACEKAAVSLGFPLGGVCLAKNITFIRFNITNTTD